MTDARKTDAKQPMTAAQALEEARRIVIEEGPRAYPNVDRIVQRLDALAAQLPEEPRVDRMKVPANSYCPATLVACLDCGTPYPFQLDSTLPDEQWRMIHDSEGGLLCAGCMVARAAKLHGAVAVRMQIEFA